MQRGSRGLGMSGHHEPNQGAKDEWLTPPDIIAALGPFDLDPCAPINRPWETAAQHYTVRDDGLFLPWHGFVWCNPPYGGATGQWMSKLADHGNGIALVFARTETEMFFSQVWQRADAILFMRGRVFFHHVTGERAAHNSGAPSCLIAYGHAAVQRLRACAIAGHLVTLAGAAMSGHTDGGTQVED